MIIECDSRQQKQEHITNYFDRAGIKHIQNKLYSGDYKRVDSTNIIVDTKKDLVEMASNLCRTTEHTRIKKEIEKAKEIGCERFIFLIASETVKTINDVGNWEVPVRKNGTLYTNVKPLILQKTMITMSEKYQVEFMFCPKNKMGEIIYELLKGNYEIYH